jgi:PqqD family protein of HPr-rel-A system
MTDSPVTTQPALVRNPEVTLERVGREAILHDRTSGRVHVVNGSAARLWELLDGEPAVDDLAAAFAASYGLPVGVVRPDVEEILAAFRDLSLLR